MENQEGRPEAEQDKIVKEVSVRHSAMESTLYHRHESGKVTKQGLTHHQNGEFFFDNPVDITNNPQTTDIDWDRKFVDQMPKNQVRAWNEPVKKGKEQTLFKTVAELGKKIVPAKLRGGK